MAKKLKLSQKLEGQCNAAKLEDTAKQSIAAKGVLDKVIKLVKERAQYIDYSGYTYTPKPGCGIVSILAYDHSYAGAIMVLDDKGERTFISSQADTSLANIQAIYDKIK